MRLLRSSLNWPPSLATTFRMVRSTAALGALHACSHSLLPLLIAVFAMPVIQYYDGTLVVVCWGRLD